MLENRKTDPNADVLASLRYDHGPSGGSIRAKAPRGSKLCGTMPPALDLLIVGSEDGVAPHTLPGAPLMIPFPGETEALLFDCDGTLVDSMPIHIEAWQATLDDYGVTLPKRLIDQCAGMPTNVIVEHINNQFGVDLDPQSISDEKEARYIARLDEVLPIEAVLATAWAHHGKLAMAVVSGSVRSIVVAALETVNAVQLFPVIVTADDPVAPKPSPAIFLEAARRLRIPPEKCHVFEDADAGIAAARAAGMTWTDVRELV